MNIFTFNFAYSDDHERYCKVASYTFMALLDDIAVSDPKYGLG